MSRTADLARAVLDAKDNKIADLQQQLRMIISHSSGGALSKPSDIYRSTNDICVEISRHKNEIYAQGKEAGFKAGWRQGASSGRYDPDLVAAGFEEWKGTWT